MVADLQQRIRSSMMNWKLSVKTKNKKEEKFNDNVFKELVYLTEVVFEKYSESSPEKQRQFQKIENIWPMTERSIKKIHIGIYRRIRSTPTTASPFICSFNIDIPKEVFRIVESILQRSS